MSDTEQKKIKAKALREFTDAGTETTYAKDQEVDLTAGEFDNYRAAGLVEPIAETPAKPARG